MEDSKYQALQDIGRIAHDALAEMVAASLCDYDRLQELRDALSDGGAAQWANDNPQDAAELAELEREAGDCADEDEARQRIQEDPLSVEFRSGWASSPDEFEPDEFCVLLSTGGPAVRIVGELGGRGGYRSVRLQVQDWFTPWADYSGADESMLCAYLDCLGVSAMADNFRGR